MWKKKKKKLSVLSAFSWVMILSCWVIYLHCSPVMTHPALIWGSDYWTALVNTASMLFSNLYQPSSSLRTLRNLFFHPDKFKQDIQVRFQNKKNNIWWTNNFAGYFKHINQPTNYVSFFFKQARRFLWKHLMCCVGRIKRFWGMYMHKQENFLLRLMVWF